MTRTTKRAEQTMVRKSPILMARRMPKRLCKSIAGDAMRKMVSTAPLTAITAMEPSPTSTSPRGRPWEA